MIKNWYLLINEMTKCDGNDMDMWVDFVNKGRRPSHKWLDVPKIAYHNPKRP